MPDHLASPFPNTKANRIVAAAVTPDPEPVVPAHRSAIVDLLITGTGGHWPHINYASWMSGITAWRSPVDLAVEGDTTVCPRRTREFYNNSSPSWHPA